MLVAGAHENFLLVSATKRPPPWGGLFRRFLSFLGLHQMAGHKVAGGDLLQLGLGLFALVAGLGAAAGKVAAPWGC